MDDLYVIILRYSTGGPSKIRGKCSVFHWVAGNLLFSNLPFLAMNSNKVLGMRTSLPVWFLYRRQKGQANIKGFQKPYIWLGEDPPGTATVEDSHTAGSWEPLHKPWYRGEPQAGWGLERCVHCRPQPHGDSRWWPMEAAVIKRGSCRADSVTLGAFSPWRSPVSGEYKGLKLPSHGAASSVLCFLENLAMGL